MGYCRIVAQPAALSIAYSKADLFPQPSDPLYPRVVGVAHCELGGDYPEGYSPWRFRAPRPIRCNLEVCTLDSYSLYRAKSDGGADASESRDPTLIGTREQFGSYLKLRTPHAAAAFVMPEGYEPSPDETTDLPVHAIFALSAVVLFQLSHQAPHASAPVAFMLVATVYGVAFAGVGGWVARRIARRSACARQRPRRIV